MKILFDIFITRSPAGASLGIGYKEYMSRKCSYFTEKFHLRTDVATSQLNKASKGYHWEVEWAALSLGGRREGCVCVCVCRMSQETQSLCCFQPATCLWATKRAIHRGTLPFCSRQLGGLEQNDEDLIALYNYMTENCWGLGVGLFSQD